MDLNKGAAWTCWIRDTHFCFLLPNWCKTFSIAYSNEHNTGILCNLYKCLNPTPTGHQWCPSGQPFPDWAPSNQGDHALLHPPLCTPAWDGRDGPLGGGGWTGEEVQPAQQIQRLPPGSTQGKPGFIWGFNFFCLSKNLHIISWWYRSSGLWDGHVDKIQQ